MKKIFFNFFGIISLSLLILMGCSDNNISPVNQGTQMGVTAVYTTTGICNNSYLINISGVDYAFLALGAGGMQILNVSNPRTPLSIATYNVSGVVEETYAIKINDTPYVFIASGSGGVTVLNLSIINSALTDTVISFSGDYINSVFVDTANNILYTGGQFGKMYVMNVANLPIVTNLSTYQSASNINEIQVNQNTAYIAQDSGMDIVNVVNPSSPLRYSMGNSNDYAYDVKIKGNLALVSNNENGVVIFDITNPANPQQVSILNTYDIALACSVSGNLVYVAEDASGIEAFDISNPSNPKYVAYYNSRYYSENVFYFNGYTYVSDYNDLVILKYP